MRRAGRRIGHLEQKNLPSQAMINPHNQDIAGLVR